MSALFRVADGGRIDRAHVLPFTFDGRHFEGLAGDTLASALLANGVHLVGRSFKYHRPRGIVAAGSEEPNALVRVVRDAARDTPNLRATQVELHAGLEAWSQNRWPSLAWDTAAVNSLFAPLFPAGFYYKTFMGPRWLGPTRTWSKFFEPMIRRVSGLGRAPVKPDPDTYLNHYAHCEVLVIGGGPAGIAAAISASESGADVMLCDEQAELGGSLLAERRAVIDGEPAAIWLDHRITDLTRAGVRLLSRTTAFGYYACNFIALAERLSDHSGECAPGTPRERLWQVRAREIVIAAGAIERPLIFAHNDRPGVMLADAGRTYLNRYGVKPGAKVLIVTACDSAYAAALDLRDADVEIAALCDLRQQPPEDLVAQTASADIAVRVATSVITTRGRLRVTAATTAKLKDNGTLTPDARIDCEVVLMSGGWTPSVHLFSQSRGRLVWDDARQAYLPGNSVQRERSAGACRGLLGFEAIIADGYAAGEDAARAAGGKSVERHTSAVINAPSYAGGVLGKTVGGEDGTGSKSFVDFQNDVTVRDLELAVREGFHSIEHVKRYTTTGMATDQGKTSNLHALAIVAGATAKTIPEVGLTSFRQPYTPVTFGTLAGPARGVLMDPMRCPPSHAWACAHGAIFEDVGPWRRARSFPRDGEELDQALVRECETVRSTVGLFDASTLGKIEVEGPDAVEFLQRIYVNRLQRLEVGRCRYAVLLNDAGFVIDDGVIARLASDRFHVTTTTGGAASVLNRMEDFLQTEWSDLAVWLTSTTEQWATMAVQGPLARSVLEDVFDDVDLSADAVSHMGVIESQILGVPARIFRVSFTGELGFEINVPCGFGCALWVALEAAVAATGGCVYGTDAMHVLRAEKGYVIVGQETDGTTTPDDLGYGDMVGTDKPDFLGKRSLELEEMKRTGRRQMVGLLTEHPQVVLDEGAQVTAIVDPPVGTASLGFVSSAYYSATLGRSIALALVAGGRDRMGDRLYVPMPEESISVEVVAPVFYDPKGDRLRV